MRLALVGWAADSGVGRELIDALRHLPVSALFLLQNPHKPTREDLLPDNIHIHRCEPSGADLVAQMNHFLERTRVDTILTWEVPGSWEFPAIWKKANVRWVSVIHWDWFSADQLPVWALASLLIAPNRMCQQELQDNHRLQSTYLPVPLDTERLIFKERQKADLFVSTYGFGGFHNRRAIPQVFAAWRQMAEPPPLVIRTQVANAELQPPLPKNVSVKIGNLPEPGDLYNLGDIAVQPSRYEGLGLSMLEAQACGVPVIVVDAAPMNEIARELRVPCSEVNSVSVMGKSVKAYTPSVDGLCRVVQEIQGKDIRALSRDVRAKVERHFSWTALLPSWMNVLSGK